MNKPKVLITWPLKPTTVERFSTDIDFVCLPGNDDLYQETMTLIPEMDGLMVLGLTVDQALIEKGNQLKVISNMAVGYDNIDIEYATSKGILVSNTPHSVTTPTAHTAIGLLLSITRKISLLDRKVREEQYENWSVPLMTGTSIEGKVIGIMGWGRIGEAVAKLAQAFDMKVIYYKRTRLSKDDENELDVKYFTREELFASADVVSLHMPLNQETKHMIGKELMSLMKPNAYLMNTARGGVIDPDALYELLSQNKIAGAASDVFWDEPRIPDRFKTLDNFVMTPHIGTSTKKARRDMLIEVHDNLVSYFKTGEVISRVV